MKPIYTLLCVGVAAPALLASVASAMVREDPSRADTGTKKNPCVCLSEDVIGTSVVSTSGEKLGKIEDLVIHPNGEIAYGVLSFGGVMGVGDKLFAVPWSTLRAEMPKSVAVNKDAKDKDVAGKEKDDKAHREGKAEKSFVLPVDKEKLKTAPGFDKSHWPVMADANWAKDVDAFYGGSRENTSRAVEASAKATGPVWKATELKGFNVTSASGEKLGDIKNLAIDTNGHIAYAVVSVGGFLGMGDRMVPVPWDALKITRDASNDKRTVMLSATKEQLKGAPEFHDSKDKRAQMCDPAWVGRVYEYYSVRPYWPQSEGT
jgi:sporulation protein YlmC with PRC-barrel domain